jgi:hypothetical protein
MRLKTRIVHRVDRRCGGSVGAPGWSDTVEAIGGNHFTLRNGTLAAPRRDVYPGSARREPRTNVGVTADGHVLMVTVDGRLPGYSFGVKLAEMGRLMSLLGAVSAINLDGGSGRPLRRWWRSSTRRGTEYASSARGAIHQGDTIHCEVSRKGWTAR